MTIKKGYYNQSSNYCKKYTLLVSYDPEIAIQVQYSLNTCYMYGYIYSEIIVFLSNFPRIRRGQ